MSKNRSILRLILPLFAIYTLIGSSLLLAEEAKNILWHGANLVVEIPDSMVRIDNADTDLAKVLKALKPESYALLFSFVDKESHKKANLARMDGDSPPLPYATIAVPRDYLHPDSKPSMTPAQIVEAMKKYMEQEKTKGPGNSNSAVISESEHHITILTRSTVERTVGGKVENRDMAHISAHVNAGKFLALISVSGLWTDEQEVYALAQLNHKLRNGLKIILDAP